MKPKPKQDIQVLVEVPRFGFVKRREDGSVDYVSPFPCPFNYGSIPGTLSEEGDRMDAVILGRRLARGTILTLRIVAVAHFIDAGKDDPKWVCSNHSLTRLQRLTVIGFFRAYAPIKRLLNRIRGKKGPTQYRGLFYNGYNAV